MSVGPLPAADASEPSLLGPSAARRPDPLSAPAVRAEARDVREVARRGCSSNCRRSARGQEANRRPEHVHRLLPARPGRSGRSALSLNRWSARAVGASWRVELRRAPSAGTPASSESAIDGAAAASRIPGWSSVNRPALFARNGRIVGSVSVATANVGGVSEIVSWIDGPRLSEGREGGVEVHEQLRLLLGDRRDLARGGCDRGRRSARDGSRRSRGSP